MNPKMFEWARMRAGITQVAVAKVLGIDSKTVASWEEGRGAPNYQQLEKLAYDVFRIPLAGFYCDKPPADVDPIAKFRYLAADDLDKIEKSVYSVIKKIAYFQAVIEDMVGDDNKFQLADSISHDTEKSAVVIRSLLKWDTAIEKLRTSQQRLDCIRSRLVDFNIYVFKDAYRSDSVSGFCLPSKCVPVISINNSTTFNRQLFTLLHELTHILINSASITFKSDDFVSRLSLDKRREEIFCNAVAGETLVPKSEFLKILKQISIDDESIYSDLADHFCVSREVIARKMLDCRIIPQLKYEELTSEWIESFRRSRETDSSSTGNYYSNQKAYLGKDYITLIVKNLVNGKINRWDAARYLSIKEKNLDTLLGVKL